MTWMTHHSQSEQLAQTAELAFKQGDVTQAAELYRLAAEQETLALADLDTSKKRTLGITTVSAASLWLKAHDYQQAQSIAYKGLADSALPAFAVKELKEIVQVAWNQESTTKAGLEFIGGEVLISVSGGQVVRGGAPLDFILHKVDDVSRIFYRTIEMLLNRPFRRRGMPSQEIQEQFRPWLFQAPPGSYQFAVRVERPRQPSLFPEAEPQVEQITDRFMQIVKASADDSEGELVNLVPDKDYREAFMKLTRNLAPTGKVFGKLEISSPSSAGTRQIVLTPEARETINKIIRDTRSVSVESQAEEVIKLHGVLRGLQLDNDWLEINEGGDEAKLIRIFEAGEAIDDVVGSMVNRRVVVDVVRKPSNKYSYRDMQLEE